MNERWRELGYDRRPELLVGADIDGNSHALSRGDIESEVTEPFLWIGREFIVGKPVKIWWPPERAGAVR